MGAHFFRVLFSLILIVPLEKLYKIPRFITINIFFFHHKNDASTQCILEDNHTI